MLEKKFPYILKFSYVDSFETAYNFLRDLIEALAGELGATAATVVDWEKDTGTYFLHWNLDNKKMELRSLINSKEPSLDTKVYKNLIKIIKVYGNSEKEKNQNIDNINENREKKENVDRKENWDGQENVDRQREDENCLDLENIVNKKNKKINFEKISKETRKLLQELVSNNLNNYNEILKRIQEVKPSDLGEFVITINHYCKSIDADPKFKKMKHEFAIGFPILGRDKHFYTFGFYIPKIVSNPEEKLYPIIYNWIPMLILGLNSYILNRDLKKLNKSLNFRTELSDLFLHQSMELIIRLDPSGNIIYLNPIAKELIPIDYEKNSFTKLPLIEGKNENNFYHILHEVRIGKTIENEMFSLKNIKRDNSNRESIIEKKEEESTKNELKEIRLIGNFFPIREVTKEINQIMIIAKDLSNSDRLLKELEKTRNELFKTNASLENSKKKIESLELELLHHKYHAAIGVFAGRLAKFFSDPINAIENNIHYLNQLRINYKEKFIENIQEKIDEEIKSKYIDEEMETIGELFSEINIKIDNMKYLIKILRLYSNIIEEHNLLNISLKELFNQLDYNFKKKCKENNIEYNSTISKGNKKTLPENLQKRLKIKANRTLLGHLCEIFFNNSLEAFKSIEIKDSINNKSNKKKKKKSFTPKLNLTVKLIKNNNKQSLQISVIDNGCGINKDNIKKIFKPFFVGWTNKDKEKLHIGLNLIMAKIIIEKHNGSIRVDENYKNGAKFVIDIPVID